MRENTVSKTNQIQIYNKGEKIMSVFNSVGTPLVVLMVILMIGASIFGMAISGADLFNPATSNAEANRMNAETENQQALFEQQQRIAEKQTDAQIAEIELGQQIAEQQAQQALDHEKQLNEKKTAAYEEFAQILNKMLWTLGIALSGAIVITPMLAVTSKTVVAMKTASVLNPANHFSNFPVDPWTSQEFRKRMIKQARENEVAIHQAKINQKGIQPFNNPAVVSANQMEKMPWAK